MLIVAVKIRGILGEDKGHFRWVLDLISESLIVTLNRFTELATGTHMTVGKRGFDVRSRVTINVLKDSHDLACRSWRLLASRLGGVPTTR